MNKEETQKKIDLGSKTAKDGFKNEDYVIKEFNNWKASEHSAKWLVKMGYTLEEVELVRAKKVTGSFKADIQVEIKTNIKSKRVVDLQNIQVKLVSNPQGYNQIDKRWLKKYNELWNIPPEVYKLLQFYVGEIKPNIKNPRDKRRMFVDEFAEVQQNLLVDYFSKNKAEIVSDILKGRGEFCADWMLVVLKLKSESKISSTLEPIDKVLKYFGNGEVVITKKGNIRMGTIGVQRKGGDSGRDTAQMLQFKINPIKILS